MKSAAGFITVDFLFALVMAWGFLIVFFSLSLTFTFFEVAQYIAFSTSRSFVSAHVTPDDQVDLARAKFQELMAVPIIRALTQGGWFQIDPFRPQTVDDFNFNSLYNTTTQDSDNGFIGVRLLTRAKVLERQLPFLGNTFENPDSFNTFVTSYLGREVTEAECITNFTQQRYDAILRLGGESGAAYAAGGGGNVQKAATEYKTFTDNGC